jgi:peptidyl-prolyl cis-trans isomerase SurA
MAIKTLLLLVLWVVPGAMAIAQNAGTPVEADRIVAVVNDDVITQIELDNRVSQIEAQLRQQGVALPPRAVIEKQVLERMITGRAQLHYARETGLRIDDAQLDAAITRIAQTNGLSLAQFRDAIQRDGIEWRRFREEVREEMTIARLREREVDSRVVVSEGEIDNLLASPESATGKPVEVLVSHILVRVPESTDPERLARLRARAEEAHAQASAGADFAKLAATYSDAPDALAAGNLGWRTPERLPGLFAEAVARMQPGTVSPILRSPAGFHILKVFDRRGGEITDTPVEQTHARHILIKTNELVSESEAQRKLTDLAERLKHGADFAELARLHSNDSTASRGGDLGWLYPGDTVPEFERAMNTLKPNEIGGPLKSPFGWHLIQVLERRLSPASDERKRQVAKQALRERKAQEAYQEWARQMRDRAYVEYRLEER